MAKYQITHSCGHTVEHNLVGKSVDREKKADWLAGQVCSRCWASAKQAQGPVVALSAEPAVDPEDLAARHKADAITIGMEIDRLAASDLTPNSVSWHRRDAEIKKLQRDQAERSRWAKQDGKLPSEPARLRITITWSYEVRDLLRSRGYQYDGHARSWERCVGLDGAEAELAWLAAQGWTVPDPAPHLTRLRAYAGPNRPTPGRQALAEAEARRDKAVAAERARAEAVAAATETESRRMSVEAAASALAVVSVERTSAETWTAILSDGSIATGWDIAGEGCWASTIAGVDVRGSETDRIGLAVKALLG